METAYTSIQPPSIGQVKFGLKRLNPKKATGNDGIPAWLLKKHHEEFAEVVHDIRELKQGQRRRQQERHKFASLVEKNNSFARSARAFFTFVHFVAVVSKTTT